MKYVKHAVTMALLAVLCGAAGCATSRFGADGVAYVGADDLKAASCGFGFRVAADKSVRGRALTVAGKTYARGVGTHPESAIGIFLLKFGFYFFPSTIACTFIGRPYRLMKPSASF